MRVDRREGLTLLAAGLLGSSSGALLAAPARVKAGLILPLTGERAGLGTSMARAAALAQSDARALVVTDSAVGAAAAARTAIRRGARLILGPVFSGEVRAVLTAAGAAPVVAFSNDAALAGSGAFLLGIGPAQCVEAVLRYARTRGVRAVALPPAATAEARVAEAAALAGAGPAGLSVRVLASGDVAAEMRRQPFDALLMTATDPDRALIGAARAAGAQLLLGMPGLDARPETLGLLDGAWAAAPDPAAFAGFADRYRAATGGEPGLLAALAHDAALMAQKVGAGGRAALLDPAGFSGATGAWRFRADGLAQRALAILVATPEGYVAA